MYYAFLLLMSSQTHDAEIPSHLSQHKVNSFVAAVEFTQSLETILCKLHIAIAI